MITSTTARAVIIVLVSSLAGIVANAVRYDVNKDGEPRRLPWIAPPKAPLDDKDHITLDDAHALWSTGAAFFFDARMPVDYQEGHIAGAFNLPADAFEDHFAGVASMLTEETEIICYCDGVDCELSHRLADRLRKNGFKKVRVLVNGWTVWRGKGYATHKGSEP
jgi:rhodanese-related sulfurtransferase